MTMKKNHRIVVKESTDDSDYITFASVWDNDGVMTREVCLELGGEIKREYKKTGEKTLVTDYCVINGKRYELGEVNNGEFITIPKSLIAEAISRLSSIK